MKTVEVKNKIMNAIYSQNPGTLADEMIHLNIKLSEDIQDELIAESRFYDVSNLNKSGLSSRGFRRLSGEEKEYYNKVQETSSLVGIPIPRTVFDRVFDDLEKEHPLLSELTLQNTTGLTAFIPRTQEVAIAWWGKICEDVKKKIENGFKTEESSLSKVSVYLPISKDMLNLGPIWLDRYVRALLMESTAMALEAGAIAGDGKDEPIGMIRLIDEAVEGVHTEKQPEELIELTTESIGRQILQPLAKQGVNTVGKLLLLINPLDYWSKLFLATTGQTAEGRYVIRPLPFNVTVIQSVHVPLNRMIVGKGANYFMAFGSENKITYSDEFRFLDDQRVYLAKQYANGRPMTDQSFLYFDITNLRSIDIGEQ